MFRPVTGRGIRELNPQGGAVTRPAHGHGVRPITLTADGLTLSALLSEPAGPPRAVVVALHGGGMTAGYFDGHAHPDLSLLMLGERLGYTVLAVDRPGYGASAGSLPEGQTLTAQCLTLRAALSDFTSRYATGAGLFLLAHSYGCKLALSCAADDERAGFLGLDLSGCGHRYAIPPQVLRDARRHGRHQANWGPLRLYPPGTFRASASVVAPMPLSERHDAARWTGRFPAIAARVNVPVRMTFAEHESWWHHDDAAVAELAAAFPATTPVRVERQPAAGHNISLGWAARSYHLRALAFLEECLAARPPAAVRTPTPG